jgi:hypothetical protein
VVRDNPKLARTSAASRVLSAGTYRHRLPTVDPTFASPDVRAFVLLHQYVRSYIVLVMTSGAQDAGAGGIRRNVTFQSGGDTIAAWHYPGTNGACIVMAGGMAVTKEPATDSFAYRFHQAGYTIVAFDYRRIGDSGGTPRQVVRVSDHVADWHAAISFAAALEEVNPHRIGLWGFSLTGGIVLEVAARSVHVTAAVAQAPVADGPAATRNAASHQKKRSLARFMALAVADAIGALVRRPPILIPLAGRPGEVAMLTTPDAIDGERAFDAERRYPEWRQQVAARSALRAGFYRPGRFARQVSCALLVVVSDHDESALEEPAVRVAERAARSELVRLSGGHYAAFLESHDEAVAAELHFFGRHLLGAGSSSVPDSVDARQAKGSSTAADRSPEVPSR